MPSKASTQWTGGSVRIDTADKRRVGQVPATVSHQLCNHWALAVGNMGGDGPMDKHPSQTLGHGPSVSMIIWGNGYTWRTP